jgi:starch phosphorylase
VPITYVTNGVHAATWVAPLIRALYEEHIGEDWIGTSHDAQAWATAVDRIPEEELWQAHSLLKQRLVAFVRQYAFRARLAGEESEGRIEAQTILDPESLTIGFARRVAGYKRWGLVLSDEQRLRRLMSDQTRPVQFVFAGKAHPQDEEGKLALQRLAQWSCDNQSALSCVVSSNTQHRLAFLEEYDQEIARLLVQSVDVWLNVPRRPFEASGSSGQKVATNGGVNFSVLDGWWLEGFDGANGFAIGDTTDEDGNVDERDAASLYRVLEEQIIPLYYERDAAGIPRRWVALMKRSIATLVPVFNSDRMVAEYAERIYS